MAVQVRFTARLNQNRHPVADIRLGQRRYNAWYSAWPLPIGCVLMAAGFICLEVVAHEHDGVDLASAIQGLFYSAM